MICPCFVCGSDYLLNKNDFLVDSYSSQGLPYLEDISEYLQ